MNFDKTKLVKLVLEAARIFLYGGLGALASAYGVPLPF